MKRNPTIQAILFLFISTLFSMNCYSADDMKISVVGKTYRKKVFENGTELFLNRSYVIENLPENSELKGFYFLASAGGTDVIDEGVIIPSRDGIIYILARNASKIEGWTKVEGSDFKYTSSNTLMSVFQKSVIANQEIIIPLLTDFQGASPIAKDIGYINPDGISEISIRVEDLKNAFTPRTFVENARLFISDPVYRLEEVPEDFSGFRFLASRSYVDEEATIIPKEDGKVYVIARSGGVGNGWTAVPNTSFFSDFTCDDMIVYERMSLAGERIPLPKGNDMEGVSPLAKEIEYVMNEELPSQISVIVEADKSVFDNRYFNNGALLFKNRTYYIDRIPSQFSDFQFLASNGAEADEEGAELIAAEEGYLYVIARNTLSLGNGWEIMPNTEFIYSDTNNSMVSVFRREVQAGEKVLIPKLETSDFRGITPLAKKIIYGTTIDVQGELIDIRKAVSGNEVFPQNSRYSFNDNLPLYLKNKEYAVTLIEYEGVTHLKSDESCEIYIALHYNNLESDIWINTGDSFSLGGGGTYYVYKYLYNPLQEWLEVPGALNNNGMTTLVFADKIVWDNPRKLPESVVIARSSNPKSYFLTNPSLTIMPDGDYIASCTGPYRTSSKNTVTIFRSTDKGKTWATQVINSVETNYGNLFVHNGDLYIMGTSGVSGHVTIRKSTDKGVTWTNPIDENSGLLLQGEYHSAPVPVVIHNGRVWRAMETNPTGTVDKKAIFVMSASASSDLLKASSWTTTNALDYNTNWDLGTGKIFKQWREGNVVVDPQGNIVNVVRVDEEQIGETAAIATVKGISELSFDPQTDFITMPGGGKKFTIRYDDVSKRYWSLTNIVDPVDIGKSHNGFYQKGIHCGLIRNRLALISSYNLRTWEVVDTLINYESPFFYGFQYVDWQFDGEDIIAVSRTAFEDVRGLPVRQHDANYFLFHRFTNFRRDEVSVQSDQIKVQSFINYNNSQINVYPESHYTFDVYVYNVLGICVHKGRNQNIVQTTDWNKGVYTVCVIQNSKVISEKIIVN